MQGRVLIAAGSDSGGGAGIQADIKTVTALGGFAMTAVTALTAQNTQGVFGVVGIEPAFIRQQMELVLGDLGADAIKTGMLHDAPVIEAVAQVLEERAAGLPTVIDPVMVAQTGDPLLADSALETLKRRLVPLADVLTPNQPEAERLTGLAIETTDHMRRAAEALLGQGARAVLIKGGHMSGETLVDLLVGPDGERVFESPRIKTRHLHGTGCTLASAIATGLAQGMALEPAVARARDYLQAAIKSAPGYGQGDGPVNHGHTVGSF